MSRFTTSTLGWVYIGLAAAWTILLAAGLLYLYRHRQLPFLQFRRLSLMFIAVILLHLYAVVCMISYTIHPIIPCDVQFWVMSIYLPFGIALLQAANSQFLYVASQQRRYANFTNLDELKLSEKSAPINQSLPWWKQTVTRVQRADRTTRIVVYIGIGMGVEVKRSVYTKVTRRCADQTSWHSHCSSISDQRCFTQAMVSLMFRSPVQNREESSVSQAGNGMLVSISLKTTGTHSA